VHGAPIGSGGGGGATDGPPALGTAQDALQLTLKIIDFGLSKTMGEADLTRSGGVGSPAFMAPEVSRSCACIGSPCLRYCVHGASIELLLWAWWHPGAVFERERRQAPRGQLTVARLLRLGREVQVKNAPHAPHHTTNCSEQKRPTLLPLSCLAGLSIPVHVVLLMWSVSHAAHTGCPRPQPARHRR
jgi:serine/threonine protein kinase